MNTKSKNAMLSRIGFLSLALILVVIVTSCKKKEGAPAASSAEVQNQVATPSAARTSAPPAQTASEHFRIPPYFENPDAAGVLAPTKDPASVRPEVQAAYLVAQNKPKLLAQLPCFCYCDRFGHQSLHDCFVTDHAQTCDICIHEALEADQMENQGMTPQEIRSVIVAKYHPRAN